MVVWEEPVARQQVEEGCGGGGEERMDQARVWRGLECSAVQWWRRQDRVWWWKWSLKCDGRAWVWLGGDNRAWCE